MQTTKRVKDLDSNQVDFYKENKIILATKLTRVEYTKRIGFLGGVNQKISLVT